MSGIAESYHTKLQANSGTVIYEISFPRSYVRHKRNISGHDIFLTRPSDDYMSVHDLRPIMDELGQPLW